MNGRDLMRPTKELFALWKRYRDGTVQRGTFERRLRPIRREIDALLLRGYCNPLTRGFSKELVEHGEHLWTFGEVEGVEPNEPDVYYPTGTRNYARVVPPDDLQGSVGANWAKTLGATRVYILHDTASFGRTSQNSSELKMKIALL